jgi:transitional endoplasmic reticulum ATPase
LSFRNRSATESPAGAITLDYVEQRCEPLTELGSPSRIKVVGGTIDGVPYFACYGLSSTGTVSGAAVLDADGNVVRDVGLIKRVGAWRWVGTVKTIPELVLGGLGMIAIPAICFIYYRKARPGRVIGGPRRSSRAVDALLVVLGPVGWLFLLADRSRPRQRKLRLVLMSILAFTAVGITALLFSVGQYPDIVGWTVSGLLAAQTAVSIGMGRLQLAPPGWGQPIFAREGQTSALTQSAAGAVSRQGSSLPAGAASSTVPTPSVATPAAIGDPEHPHLVALPPANLPTFADAGGMDALKQELKDTFGLLLAFGEEADLYRISFNGILLYGPPGTGKTFIARATAGEFGMRLVQVSAGDLMSRYIGSSARNVTNAFAYAASNIPCVLFLDEFDTLAGRRDDDPNEENRRVVGQLLTCLEQYRSLRELVVMAATNSLDRLDPAIIRPGRFDRHVRVDLPDAAARRAVLLAQLRDRPTASELDLDELARRSAGRTAANLAAAVDSAALEAFRQATMSGDQVRITMGHLVDALGRGGKDRPTLESSTWDQLVLDQDIKTELRQIQLLLENPEHASAWGVDPPSGVLLAGPPGTGKTTIARVLAAQAHCSFYPMTGADLTSKWVGEAEANVARLFTRARENAPSIIFIDEIDAIGSIRGASGGAGDRLVNQLLAEMDGLTRGRGVFVIGASNRPDILDPALLRGGRLSRTLWIGLPDFEDRQRLLELFTARMPLRGVDLSQLASWTNGMAGADLQALCQQAALVAMSRKAASGGHVEPTISMEDFREAGVSMLRARRHSAGASAGQGSSYPGRQSPRSSSPEA